MTEEKYGNVFEVHIRHRKKIVAHAKCFIANGEAHIQDLFVIKSFRGKGLGEVLLARILDYASDQHATRIISFCGAEPFCEGGQIPIDQEVSWYEDHGFILHHHVMGVTPCMVREMHQEVMA